MLWLDLQLGLLDPALPQPRRVGIGVNRLHFGAWPAWAQARVSGRVVADSPILTVDSGVPVVLDRVVRAPREQFRNFSPLVPKLHLSIK